MTDKVQKILNEIERLKKCQYKRLDDRHSQGVIDGLHAIEKFIKSPEMQEEPASDELNTVAKEYANNITDKLGYRLQLRRAVCFGAKWKEGQFEKNRQKHCDNITNEQAELESGFIDQHLDKHQRMPTFLDAIEYGMQLQKEQIEEALLSEVLPCFMHGGEADEVMAKLDEMLSQKK